MRDRLAAQDTVLLHELQNSRGGRAAHLERALDILLKQIAFLLAQDQMMHDHRLHAGNIGRIGTFFCHARHLTPKQVVQHTDFRPDAVIRVAAAFVMVTAIHC